MAKNSTLKCQQKRGKKMENEETGKNEPEFYTPEQLAGVLQVPLRTLEKWVFKKRLPVVKCGRLNRFPRVEIQKRILRGDLLN